MANKFTVQQYTEMMEYSVEALHELSQMYEKYASYSHGVGAPLNEPATFVQSSVGTAAARIFSFRAELRNQAWQDAQDWPAEDIETWREFLKGQGDAK